ncbi:unnamed protein product, partial [Mesorhabditis belari]|uniref:Uncharacterized protein n=1 Tax=Mesorhabditis belari TaxID=2138241 RepID=A0AAF3F6V3_9BILA
MLSTNRFLLFFSFFNTFHFIQSQAGKLARFCDLQFNSKQSMGYELGTQLQVCCGVTSFSIWNFKNAREFTIGDEILHQRFHSNDSEMWSELNLSKCTDRNEATIGFVEPLPGVNCSYMKGQTVNLQQKSVEMPSWYTICYHKNDCSSCRVDVLCANDLSAACSDISLIGSATTSTNSTIKYWYTVGKKYPFVDESVVAVTVIRQRTMEEVKSETKAVKVGVKEHILFKDLLSSEWYIVRRMESIRFVSKNLTERQIPLHVHI